ncbi:MAG TPA: flagellar basal-body rod protein FlgF [Rhizomicrobium sp.]|nr:flagellar basal-body rod protein FlgF [Rhizomicrobium sp.]
MDNTLLVSLSHQLAAYRSMDVIANNIANVSTPAFKKEGVKFEEYVAAMKPSETETGTQYVSFVVDKGTVRDLNEGRIERTGAPFDLAINGKGFFTVQTPAGERYTRDGHFQLDSDGNLVTSDGNKVMGEGGQITFSPDDGDIHIGADGTITGKQGQLGKVRVVAFDNEQSMLKEGASLYTSSETPKAADKASVQQGMLEASNVEPVVEISHMIEVTRAYQLTASMTQSQQDLMREAVSKLGDMPNM